MLRSLTLLKFVSLLLSVLKCIPLLMIGFAFCLAGNVHAASDVVTLTYPGSTAKDELTCEANYYLWIPPDVKTVQGIIVHQHGCGDGAERGCLAAAEDLHWRALAEKHDCALLGTSYRAGDSNCHAWADPRRGSRARFLQAMRDFATQTGHPEIATAPWCLWGHSGGGWWSSQMLALEPDRCVAVWLRSGSAYGKTRPAGTTEPPPMPAAAMSVPVMCNPGIQEKGDERFNLAYTSSIESFADWRSRGGLVCFAADPVSSHDCGASRYLAIPFFSACLAARLPEQPGMPLKSMPVDEARYASPPEDIKGDNGELMPIAMGSSSKDPSAACWLPNAAFAELYKSYRLNGAVANTTAPPAPYAATRHGNVLQWKAKADFETGLRGFIILRNGKEFATLPPQLNIAAIETLAPPSVRTLFQGMTYHDTPNQPPPEMRYEIAPADAAADHEYQIIAVNTAGLKSAAATVESAAE